MFILLTRIGIDLQHKKYHFLKLVLSINIIFKDYSVVRPKSGKPLKYTAAKMLRVNRTLRFLS